MGGPDEASGGLEDGLSYEDARKQRVEENKRRMLELGLKDLSATLKNGGMAQNPKINRQPKRRAPSLEELGLEKRRSSRVAAGPAVDYKDQLDFDIPGLRARYSMRGNRTSLPRRVTNEKARIEAIKAAEVIQKDVTNPSFVKAMLHSHVSSCFWLGLPLWFCKNHLPKNDDRFMLEDEQAREWETIYLAHKTGLSGGWRGFSLDHDLQDGDACLFELVSATRFKVHIIRVAEQPSAELEEVEEVKDPKDAKKKESGQKKVKHAKQTAPKKPMKVKKEKEMEERYAAAASMVALRVTRGRARAKDNVKVDTGTKTEAVNNGIKDEAGAGKEDDLVELQSSSEKDEDEPSEEEPEEDDDSVEPSEEESVEDDTWKPKWKRPTTT